MYRRQSGKDLHSIQSGPPKTESNEIDLFPFSSFSSIWFQVNKEGGKGKASIAHTHTHTHISYKCVLLPSFSLAHFLGFSASLAFFAHLKLLAKDFHSAFPPLSLAISPCLSTLSFVSFVSGISALSLAKA